MRLWCTDRCRIRRMKSELGIKVDARVGTLTSPCAILLNSRYPHFSIDASHLFKCLQHYWQYLLPVLPITLPCLLRGVVGLYQLSVAVHSPTLRSWIRKIWVVYENNITSERSALLRLPLFGHSSSSERNWLHRPEAHPGPASRHKKKSGPARDRASTFSQLSIMPVSKRTRKTGRRGVWAEKMLSR
jgi:hypothetical protein